MSFSGRIMMLAHETTPSSGTYTDIAGLRDLKIDGSNDVVDVTTKSDAGVRKLLNAKVLQSLSISGSGVAKDSATLKFIRDTWAASTQINFKLTTAGDSTGGVTYTGAWIITRFSETGNMNDAQTFDITLESADTITISSLS